MKTVFTATNFRDDCSTETRQLGETYPAIQAVEQAYQAFVTALEAVQKSLSQDADECASEFLQAVRDARSDSGWSRIVGDAAEAFAEARVKPVKVAA